MVVAAQVGDLAEVAEGDGTGSLVEGSLEFRDGDRGLGSEQREQQVGRALWQVDSVSPEAGVLSIQSQSTGVKTVRMDAKRADSRAIPGFRGCK